MSITSFRAICLFSAWTLWYLIVTLSLMLLGTLIGMASASALFGYATSPLISSATIVLVGSGLGGMMGGFRGLWAQRELGQARFRRWTGLNLSASILGLALFPPLLTWLANRLFGQQDTIETFIGSMIGLCYGLIFASILILGEWLAVRKYVLPQWRWLCGGWLAWVIWWACVGYVVSSASWID